MTAPRKRGAPATTWIAAAILAGFAYEVFTGSWKNGPLLAQQGAIIGALIFERGEYWRLLSAMFLHGDGTVGGAILHLTFNLVALMQVGSMYELMFGTRRFVTIYFVTGLAASLVSALINPYRASVGASGALFGIFGAFVLSVRSSPRWKNDPRAKSIVQQLMFWILANLAIGASIPKIDMSAHLGGLVAGLILGAVLPHRVPPPPPNQAVLEVTPHDDGGDSVPPSEWPRDGR